MHLQENTLFLTFDLGFKVTQMLLSALYIMWPIHLQGFRLLRPAIKEMHLQESTLFLTFDLGFKVTQMLLSALYIMWPIHLQGFRLLSRTNRVGDAFTQEKTLFNLDPNQP